MGVRSEQTWVGILHAEARAAEVVRHNIEAAAMLRNPRKPMPAIDPLASSSQIKRWMRANAADYDGATQLVEGANAAMDIDQDLIGDETSWLWDFACNLTVAN